MRSNNGINTWANVFRRKAEQSAVKLNKILNRPLPNPRGKLNVPTCNSPLPNPRAVADLRGEPLEVGASDVLIPQVGSGRSGNRPSRDGSRLGTAL